MDRVSQERSGRTAERVEREAVLDADVERAWEAISDPAMLERWLAEEVELEAVEGAPATFTIDGEERPGRIERVVEGRELAFSWEREPGETSLVELELVPCISGTRVLVTETRLGGGGPMAMARSWSGALARMSDLFALVLT